MQAKKEHRSMYDRQKDVGNVRVDVDQNLEKLGIVATESPEKEEEESELKYLFTVEFLAVFLVCSIKCCTSFLFTGFLKEFGMFYLKDDKFVTQIGIIGFLFALGTRFSMGALYSCLSLKGLHILNLFFETGSMLCMPFLGSYKMGFLFFYALNRMSNGILLFLQVIVLFFPFFL